MFKKIQPIYIILISTAITGLVVLFILHYFYGLNRDSTMSIGAVLLAPLFAIIVGEYLRERTEKQREEYDTLKTLVSFRHIASSQEFLGALNRVILVFDKNSEVKKLVKDLWNGYVNRESPIISKRRQIELIYAICKHMKREVTEFEIDSFFIPVTPTTIASPNPPSSVSQNPNSTVSENNNFAMKTDSRSNQSITAGFF